jgi:cell division septation protein DedD
MAQMQPQDGARQEKAAPRTPPARQSRRATSGSRVYSVQVASCRTERCVQSFVSRLREKGMDPRVSGNGARNGPTNEVLLGSFATREEAENLAGQAKDKNLRAVAYESGGRWRVSAGSFRDLEDAAQMLDRVEDAGFRGELARRPGAPQGGAGLRAIRTGSFATRREALAERSRVVGAGFQGAFVVAEPRR